MIAILQFFDWTFDNFFRKQRRSRSHSRSRRRTEEPETSSPKGLLMSTEEALALVHGDMATIRDGDVTHQCIQTNLADVICGGKKVAEKEKFWVGWFKKIRQQRQILEYFVVFLQDS